jgi:hypothetical protein
MEWLDKHPYLIEGVLVALLLCSEILASSKKVKANSIVQAVKNALVAAFAKRNPKLRLVAEAFEGKPEGGDDAEPK